MTGTVILFSLFFLTIPHDTHDDTCYGHVTLLRRDWTAQQKVFHVTVYSPRSGSGNGVLIYVVTDCLFYRAQRSPSGRWQSFPQAPSSRWDDTRRCTRRYADDFARYLTGLTQYGGVRRALSRSGVLTRTRTGHDHVRLSRKSSKSMSEKHLSERSGS